MAAANFLDSLIRSTFGTKEQLVTLIRNNRGQFTKGVSGNPLGRPHSESARVRSALSANSEQIVKVVLSAATGGDLQACKMVLDRICPPLKAKEAHVKIEIPEGACAMDIARILIGAAGSGDLAPDSAAKLVGVVGTLARIIEIEELRILMESLESIIKGRKCVRKN